MSTKAPPFTIAKASTFSLLVVVGIGIFFQILLIGAWLGPHAMRIVGWGTAGIALIAVVVLPVTRVVRWFSRQDLFSPLIAFPIIYTIWFAAGALTLDDGAARILEYSGAGLACYAAGALLARKRSFRSVLKLEAQNDWRRPQLWAVIAALSLMTIASYAYIISKVGVIALSSDAAEARLDLGKFGPAEAILFTATWTILLFVTAQLWTGLESKMRRTFAWIGLIPPALILLSLGSRGYLFVPLLTAVISRHYLRERFKIVTLAALSVVVFIALSFYGYTRDQTLSTIGSSLDGGKTAQFALFPMVYAYLYVRQPTETLHEIIRVIPRTIPYQNGLLTFGALRTLLPGHHEMSDMFFKQILVSDFVGGGQPATLLGPLYADFGPAGILLGMFITGVIVAKTYSWMVAAPNVFRVLLYSWMMQTVLFALFGALIPYITTLWIPLFWWLLHAGWLRKPRWGLASPILPGSAEVHP